MKGREDAPRQGSESAPDGLEIEPQFAEALVGVEVGHELIVIMWMHEASRDVLKNHPRDDESRPLTGSPRRPLAGASERLGLHPVTVREIDLPSPEATARQPPLRIKIGPTEAFDGTPAVDTKSASTRADG